MKHPKFDDGDWVVFDVDNIRGISLLTRYKIDLGKPLKIEIGNKKASRYDDDQVLLENCPIGCNGTWSCTWFKKIGSKLNDKTLEVLYGE